MRITGGQVFDLKAGFVERDVCTDGLYLSETSGDSETLDASGCWVIPGLVDVHFHGCVGEDFSDGTPEGLQKIADYELSQGVMYLCPAGMTLPEEQLVKVCETAANHRLHNTGGAEVVGVHLEGPFLSPAKKGAQNGEFLHDPDIPMLKRLQEASGGCVRLVTVAPEQPGAMEFIRAAAEMGITVSVGHTAADYDTAKAAFAAGANHVTHIYNGMPPIHHRAPGVILAAYDTPDVQAEMICDGIHHHPAITRATFRLFGAERMILISDTMRAAGMADGDYTLGGLDVHVTGRLATLADGTIAGSATNLMDGLRTAVSFGIPLADAVRACTYNPAESIGLSGRVGTLDIGKESSLVLLDRQDLSIRKMVFRGTVVPQ